MDVKIVYPERDVSKTKKAEIMRMLKSNKVLCVLFNNEVENGMFIILEKIVRKRGIEFFEILHIIKGNESDKILHVRADLSKDIFDQSFITEKENEGYKLISWDILKMNIGIV